MRNFFDATQRDDFKIYQLKEEAFNDLLEILPKKFLDCYVPLEKVEQSERRKEFIQSYIPNLPNLVSGEFGEILSFYLMQDIYSDKEPEAPKKWRYKENKNKPAQGTDFVLLCLNNNDNILVAAECKAKATCNTENPMVSAIAGMKKDALDRLVKTLIFLKDRALQENKVALFDRISRLLNPVDYETYDKHFKAIAIIDQAFVDDAFYQEVDINGIDFEYELVVIIVPNLKMKYQTVFSNILEC